MMNPLCGEISQKMCGVWKFHSFENFDEYMKALGVSMPLRMIGNLAKPTLTVITDGHEFSYESVSTLKTFKVSCTIGKQFDVVTADGRQCKSKMEWKSDKLVQTEWWNGKSTTITRYIGEHGEFINDCEIDGILCRRVYKKE